MRAINYLLLTTVFLLGAFISGCHTQLGTLSTESLETKVSAMGVTDSTLYRSNKAGYRYGDDHLNPLIYFEGSFLTSNDLPYYLYDVNYRRFYGPDVTCFKTSFGICTDPKSVAGGKEGNSSEKLSSSNYAAVESSLDINEADRNEEGQLFRSLRPVDEALEKPTLIRRVELTTNINSERLARAHHAVIRNSKRHVHSVEVAVDITLSEQTHIQNFQNIVRQTINYSYPVTSNNLRTGKVMGRRYLNSSSMYDRSGHNSRSSGSAVRSSSSDRTSSSSVTRSQSSSGSQGSRTRSSGSGSRSADSNNQRSSGSN